MLGWVSAINSRTLHPQNNVLIFSQFSMNFKRILSFAIVFAGCLSAGFAQDKFAYFDENYAMPLLPEYKAVQAEMEAFQKQIKAELDKMEKEYQDKAKALKDLASKPDASRVVLEAGQKELETLDKRIQKMETDAQEEAKGSFAKKMDPINTKVGKAMEEVAKELGGVYVFRRESAMFVVEENNVSDLVLKKLGVTPTAPVAGRGNLKSTNKLGYFDQNYVVPLLPEFKKAKKDLETFQNFLKQEMEKIQTDGSKLVQILEQAGNSMPPAEKQAKMEELQKLDAKMQEMQQTSNGKVQEKYTKLLEPIIKNLQTKVDEVAKENGFTYIFRLEVSLEEPKEANISDLVLKKLGITPPPPVAEKTPEKKN